MNYSIPLVFAALSHFDPQTFTTHRLKRDLVQPLEFTKLIEALSYGDNCSYAAEEIRENFVKSGILNPTEIVELLNKFQSAIVKLGLPLCSSEKLVICDKIGAKCVCGDPGRRSFLGDNHPSGHAARFVPDMKRGLCRWGESTTCAPKEYTPTKSEHCTSRTHCTSRKTGNTCQLSDMVNEFASRGTNNGVKAFFSGEICTCQSDDKPKVPHEHGSDSKRGKSQAVCTNRGVDGVVVTLIATLAISILI